jgi:hypothetical protein
MFAPAMLPISREISDLPNSINVFLDKINRGEGYGRKSQSETPPRLCLNLINLPFSSWPIRRGYKLAFRETVGAERAGIREAESEPGK